MGLSVCACMLVCERVRERGREGEMEGERERRGLAGWRERKRARAHVVYKS